MKALKLQPHTNLGLALATVCLCQTMSQQSARASDAASSATNNPAQSVSQTPQSNSALYRLLSTSMAVNPHSLGERLPVPAEIPDTVSTDSGNNFQIESYDHQEDQVRRLQFEEYVKPVNDSGMIFGQPITYSNGYVPLNMDPMATGADLYLLGERYERAELAGGRFKGLFYSEGTGVGYHILGTRDAAICGGFSSRGVHAEFSTTFDLRNIHLSHIPFLGFVFSR